MLADDVRVSQGHQFIGCGSVGEASPAEAEKAAKEKHSTWKACLSGDDADIIWEPPSDPSTPRLTRAPVHTTLYGLIAMLTVQGHSGVQVQHHTVTPATPPVSAGVERHTVTAGDAPLWVCRRKRDATGQEATSGN